MKLSKEKGMFDFKQVVKDYEEVEKNLGQVDYVDERGLFFHLVDDTLWVWHSGAKCWAYDEELVVKGELIPVEDVVSAVSLGLDELYTDGMWDLAYKGIDHEKV